MKVQTEIKTALENLKNDKISRFNQSIEDILQYKSTTAYQSRQKEVAQKFYGN